MCRRGDLGDNALLRPYRARYAVSRSTRNVEISATVPARSVNIRSTPSFSASGIVIPLLLSEHVATENAVLVEVRHEPYTKHCGLRPFISSTFHGGFGDGLHSCQVVIGFDSKTLPLVTGVVGGDDIVLSSRVKVGEHMPVDLHRYSVLDWVN